MIAGMSRYVRTGCPASPIWYASSAMSRCRALRSSALYIATEVMPSSRAARAARMAISPRLAISSLRMDILGSWGMFGTNPMGGACRPG